MRIVWFHLSYNLPLLVCFPQGYLDHIIQPHSTFNPATYAGLLKDKRAVVVATAGGPTLNGPMDATIPYMKQALGFIGVQDVAVVAVNGTASPAAADAIAAGIIEAKSAVGIVGAAEAPAGADSAEAPVAAP